MFDSHDLISIGDLQVDYFFELDKEEATLRQDKKQAKICFNYADKIPVHRLTKSMAGNACNVAVAARRLGLRSALVTTIGKDEESQIAVQGITKERLDARYIKRAERTNVSGVINYLGERTILVYHEERDYTLPKLARSKFVYVTSMRPGWEVIIKPLTQYLEKTGAKLAYNPGTYQLRAGTKQSQPLLDMTEIIFINREEAALFVNKSAETPISELLTAVHRHGPKIVVITDGPRGSYVSDGTGQYQLGTFDVPVIERTGCGDAFAAGFVSALIEGKDTLEAMRWGSFESAGVLQQVGPQAGLLTKKDLELYKRKYPDFVAKELARYSPKKKA